MRIKNNNDSNDNDNKNEMYEFLTFCFSKINLLLSTLNCIFISLFCSQPISGLGLVGYGMGWTGWKSLSSVWADYMTLSITVILLSLCAESSSNI